MDNWLVEKWEDDKVQVDINDGKLHITTTSEEDGVQVWLKRDIPRNFTFEYDFTPQSKTGFFLIFFCAQALNGDDVLSDKVQADKSAKTLFIKYTGGMGQVRSYHCSYRRGEEANCNLRKNPKLVLLKQEKLDELLPQGKTVHVKLTKKGDDILLEVDGKTFMSYTDKDNPYAGGRLALRQVYESEATYANFKLTEIK